MGGYYYNDSPRNRMGWNAWGSSEQGQVVGSCQHGNQSLGPLKYMKLLNYLRKHQVLKRDSCAEQVSNWHNLEDKRFWTERWQVHVFLKYKPPWTFPWVRVQFWHVTRIHEYLNFATVSTIPHSYLYMVIFSYILDIRHLFALSSLCNYSQTSHLHSVLYTHLLFYPLQ